MECNFQVGDEVVCIANDNFDWEHAGIPAPALGSIYKVSAIHPDCEVHETTDRGVGLDLEGLFNPCWAYPASNFRKVEKRTTAVEQFTRVPVGDTSRWDKSRRKVTEKSVG